MAEYIFENEDITPDPLEINKTFNTVDEILEKSKILARKMIETSEIESKKEVEINKKKQMIYMKNIII